MPTLATAADRRFSLLDRLIGPIDQALRTLAAPRASSTAAARPYPAANVGETITDPDERRRIGALMRVNHAGEVAAQALYQGQALVAGTEPLRESLLAAGREEADHLDWCSRRIGELGTHVSYLSPLWYAGSFVIGALAGLQGDRFSLGFVGETERQVGEHLRSHLQQIPTEDSRSRAIIEQMHDDEERHGNDAMSAGGAPLPTPVRVLMKFTARIMTGTASRI
jgi:ubiquinone biosynthesis monooxygenase Coq7